MRRFLCAFLCLLLLASYSGIAQSAPQAAPAPTSSPATTPANAPAAASATSTPTTSVPATPALALAQAEGFYRAEKYKEAMRGFEQALKMDAKSGPAYEGAVRTYIELGMVKEAWTTAQEGLKQAPSHSSTHTAMGEILLRKGKIEEAQREFINAYNMNDRDARAPFGLYWVYRSASYYGKAKEMLDTAYAIDPQDPAIQHTWIRYRPLKERMADLEQRVKKESDSKKRSRLQQVLEAAKAEEKTPHSCKAASSVAETQVQLKTLMPDPQNMVGVELKVMINGRPLNLQLDTGASGILLRQNVASGIGVVPAVATTIGGAGDEGGLAGYHGFVDSIKVGTLEFQNCTVAVTETMNRKGTVVLSEVDGLIGADVFSSYLISIDFPGEKMTLKPLPRPAGAPPDATTLISAGELAFDDEEPTHDRYIAPEMRNYTPFFRFGHFMLIPTKVGDAEPKLFMIDSGAYSSHISLDAAREQTQVFHDLDIQVEGLSGKVKEVGKASGRSVLRFGRVAQENVNMMAMDESGFSNYLGVEVSGTLGYTTLAFMQMDIDYRDGLVNFTYDPKKYRPVNRWKQQGKN